jgi:hypothetical protein
MNKFEGDAEEFLQSLLKIPPSPLIEINYIGSDEHEIL